jgi:multicomponent Na+:H+ antiporter subunit B
VNARARIVVFGVAAAGALVVVLWGLSALPGFGSRTTAYGKAVNDRVVRERHATNAVASVVFDYRGFDTLGEELILVGSVTGVVVLLRARRRESAGPARQQAPGRPAHPIAPALILASLGSIAPFTTLGIYLIAHGQATPGGGFQGGAALVAAPVLVLLAMSARAFHLFDRIDILEAAEAAGALGFIAVGIAGLGTAYLFNVFPLGSPGSVFSAGTIGALNEFVGLCVAAGITLIVAEEVQQTERVRVR